MAEKIIHGLAHESVAFNGIFKQVIDTSCPGSFAVIEVDRFNLAQARAHRYICEIEGDGPWLVYVAMHSLNAAFYSARFLDEHVWVRKELGVGSTISKYRGKDEDQDSAGFSEAESESDL